MEKPVADKIGKLVADVKQTPADALSWGKLGMNLQLHGFQVEAQTCFEQAHRLNPDDFRWPYLNGIGMAEQGLPNALAWLKKANAIDAQYAPLYVYIGEALLHDQQEQQASEAFERALALKPGFVRATFGMAKAARQREDYVSAISLLNKAIALDKTKPEFVHLLIDIHASLSQDEKAAQLKSQHVALLQKKSDGLPMPDAIRDAYEAEGVSLYWRYENGKKRMANADYRGAILEFEKALEIREDAEVLYKKAICYLTLNDKENALTNVRRAAHLTPERSRYVSDYGSLLAETNPQEGEEVLRQALKQDPSDQLVVHNYATFLKRHKRWYDLIYLFRDAYEDNHHEPFFQSNFAWFCSVVPDDKARSPREALAVIRNIQRRNPVIRPALYEVFAAVYAVNNDFDQAIHFSELSMIAAKNSGDAAGYERLAQRHSQYQQKRPWILPTLN
ncbi:MAG: tetratricopeptide repeat protein [Calditrichia bacterium]